MIEIEAKVESKFKIKASATEVLETLLWAVNNLKHIEEINMGTGIIGDEPYAYGKIIIMDQAEAAKFKLFMQG